MSIGAVNYELDYELNELEEKAEGTDGQRKYVILESGEKCKQCSKINRMNELGIEKISFQVYQLAEEKLFNMDFMVTAEGGRLVCLHFANRIVSPNGNVAFFSEVQKVAIDVGAAGLAILANKAAALASRPQLPPDKSSAYLRCMDGCDDIQFEPFKLLCYLACTIWADDTPGS